MNRKFLALLLLLPVALFATDRLTSTPNTEGGGKEKKTTQTSTQPETVTPEQATPQEELIPEEQQAQAQVDEPTVAAENKIESAEVKAFKNAIEPILATYEEMRNSEATVWVGDERVPKDETAWLKKHVEQILEAANPRELSLGRSFSRCPSGYHIVLISTDQGLNHEGWMLADVGCWDEPIGKFKYNVDANFVQVFAGDQLMNLGQYLKLYKAAHA